MYSSSILLCIRLNYVDDNTKGKETMRTRGISFFSVGGFDPPPPEVEVSAILLLLLLLLLLALVAFF